MKYVLYDIETDQAATDWATIIEFGDESKMQKVYLCIYYVCIRG